MPYAIDNKAETIKKKFDCSLIEFFINCKFDLLLSKFEGGCGEEKVHHSLIIMW